MSDKGFIEEGRRRTPVFARPDVLVVGGGAAGLAAACAAARAGADTLLVERHGFLGGTLTAVTLGGLCGGFGLFDDELRPLVAGLYGETIERLERRDGILPVRRSGKVHGVPYDPSLLSLVCDELLDDYRVSLLLRSQIVDVLRDGVAITSVIVANAVGRSAIVPRVVIDCSGDGEVSMLAGAAFDVGDGSEMQFASCMFRMSGVDVAAFSSLSREEVSALLEHAVADGYDLPRTAAALYPGPIPNIVHLNCTKIARKDGSPFDLVDPGELTAAEQEGRRQAYLYQEVARKYLPGFSRARIVDLGADLGIRETRHILGDYVLTEKDIENCIKPHDGIVCSAWPVEAHARGRSTIWKHMPDGEYYKIPYRSLIARNFSNLLIAGRNLSATHMAQASARVSATCYGMGEAAGVAAALALDGKDDVRAIAVPSLLTNLENYGALLQPRW